MQDLTTADRLLIARRHAGISSIEAAVKLALPLAIAHGLTTKGLSLNGLARYERGVSLPNIDAVRVLAKVYGVKITDIAPDLPDLPPTEAP